MLATKEWCGLAVESSVAWPTEKKVVQFEGYDLELQPA